MYFEDEIKTTRVSSTKLGIKGNLTQEEFNLAIVKYLESLNLSSPGAVESTIISAVDVTTTAGKNAVRALTFEPAAIDVKVALSDNNVSVTYDIRNLLASVPKDYEIRKTSIRIDGVKTIVVNTDKPYQVIQVRPVEFPVILDVEVKGESGDGSFLLRGSKSLLAANLDTAIEVNKQTTTSRSIENQEELNVKILEDINYLKRLIQ